MRDLAGLVHVAGHAGIAGEIPVDIELGGVAADAEVARQPERAHAVDEAEVDDLGVAALLGRDLQRRHAEDFGRSGAVHILAFAEGAHQAIVPRQVGHDAQLDLRVVGRDDHAARRRHERLADAPPFFGAHRDILQVRVGRGQPPRDGSRLPVGGMDPAGLRVDHLRQLVGIGGLELGQAAVVEQQFGQRVILGQLLQHLFVGRRRAAGGLLDHRQLELREEDLADLLGRVQVERLAGQSVGLLLERQQALAQLGALPGQALGIDQHAVALHLLQHDGGRHLDLPVDVAQLVVLGHLGIQRAMQAQRDVGILGGVFGGAVERHFIEADLRRALAAHLFVGDGLEVQHALGQCVHAMVAVRGQHVRLQHGVMRDAAQRDAVVGEHVRVVLQVLADLAADLVLQPQPHARQHGLARQLRGGIQPRHVGPAMRDRDVARPARLHRQRDADQLRQHRVDRRRLGIDADELGRVQQPHPRFELRLGGDGFVLDLGRRRFHIEQAGLLLCRGLRCVLLDGRGGLARRAHAAGVGQRFAGGLAQPGLEAIAAEKVSQPGAIFAAIDQGIERRDVRGEVAIGLDGQQLAALGQPVERIAQVLADHALDLAGAGDHVVERAVFAQPLDRCLRPHLGHARHVVHGVTDQRQVIDDLLGRHAELGLHAGRIERLIAHGIDQRDVVVHQLGEVLVAGRDHGADALPGGAFGQRADHVIGLHAVDYQDGPAERAHGFVDGLDLLAQVIGHRRPVLLVGGVQLVAERLAFSVENASAILGRVVVAQLAQHVHDAVDGPRRKPFSIAQVGQCMISTVQITRAIDEQQRFLTFRHSHGL